MKIIIKGIAFLSQQRNIPTLIYGFFVVGYGLNFSYIYTFVHGLSIHGAIQLLLMLDSFYKGWRKLHALGLIQNPKLRKF
jgi:hypothetical protein